jgi:ribosomal-protein-alanine N-acetyltransferase
VRPSNGAARRLYDKLGFNEIGVRRDYYPAERGREDALILAKQL